MIKKLLAIFICVIISIQSFGILADNQEDIELDKISLLTQLGIIKGYEKGANVSVEDLKYALEAIYDTSIKINQYFAEERLKANNALKFSEIIPILVDLTGYTPYITLKYGPESIESYIKLANDIGISDGVEVKVANTINQREFAIMIYNTLFTDMLIQTSYGENPEFKVIKDENVLLNVMDIFKFEGIVEASGILALDTKYLEKDKVSHNIVRINGFEYICDMAYKADDIIGRCVEAYTYSKDNKKLAAIVIPDEFNKILEVDAEYLDTPPDIRNLRFTYYNQNDKLKSGRITANADVIYNGRLLENYKKSDFEGKEAKITFIDNNSDGKYEVAIINEYKSFVVNSISSDGIYMVDVNGNDYNFENWFKNENTIKDVSGNDVDILSIKKYSVISVRYDKNGFVTDVIMSDFSAKGNLTESEDSFKYITLDDKEYEFDLNFYESFTGKSDTPLGSEITAYLDFKGEIVGVDIYKTVDEYAYLFEILDPEQSPQPYLKFIDASSNLVFAPVSNKVTLNGKSVNYRKLYNESVFKDEKGEFKPQLIKIKKDSKGNAKSINTATTNHGLGVISSGSGFELNFDHNIGYDNNGTTTKTMRVTTSEGRKWFGAKYVASADALVFMINSVDENKCLVRLGSNIQTGVAANMDIYDVDKNYVPGAIVYYTTDGTETKYIDPYFQTYVVKDTSLSIDDEGNYITKLEAYKDGNIVTFNVENPDMKTYSYNNLTGDTRLTGVKFKDIVPGSVIQVANYPSTDDVYAYALRFMPFEDKSEVFHEAGDTDGNWNYGVNKGTFNGNGLFAYGEVLGKTDYGIITNYRDSTASEWNRHIMFKDATVVYFFDRSENEIELGSWKDIKTGDPIFTHTVAANIKCAVVYRD